jgi:YHS domain-containing protein
MFRSILEFLALLMFFAVARAVIGAAGRLFMGGMQPPPPDQSPPRGSQDSLLQSAGELRKDPVCGTFVPVATSLKRIVNGEAVYFCSADCMGRFKISSK